MTIAENQALGNDLLKKANQALVVAEADYAAALAYQTVLTEAGQKVPAIEVDTNLLIEGEKVLQSSQELVRQLKGYVGKVEGWITQIGTGQPGAPTFIELTKEANEVYPEAAKAIFG